MRAAPETTDEYIATHPPEVREILQRIRQVIQRAVPEAQEAISYRMPAFKLHGVLLYFAAFKNHIGIYPPIKGNPKLESALAPYAAGKGNLRFPLDRPIPYKLIERIAKHRARQNLAKAAGRPGARRR